MLEHSLGSAPEQLKRFTSIALEAPVSHEATSDDEKASDIDEHDELLPASICDLRVRAIRELPMHSKCWGIEPAPP